MKCVVPFIICENDLRQADHLKRCLQKLYPECTILQYQSGDQLLKESDLLKQECILFMDIVLEDASGIQVAQMIAKKRPSIIIVFISAYLDKVVDIFDAPHCYFIYKPELAQRLRPALEKAMEQLSDNRRKLCLQLKDRVVVLESADVICMERNRRMTHVTSEDQAYSVSLNLEQLLSRLPENFIICHRSYAVNLAKVEVYKRTEFVMSNGIRIPIGRSYASKVRQQFRAYMERTLNPY